jgi:hypothetical protein
MIDFIDVTEDLGAKGHQIFGNLSSLEDLETRTMRTTRQILQQWFESYAELDPEPQTRCRNCGKYANFISKRVGFVRTQFGLIRYRRAYYVCPECHQSTCPLDERLNPIESLARLRRKVAAGKFLPVAELAQSWGLGSINIFSSTPPIHQKDHSSGEHLGRADNDVILVNQTLQSILAEAG